MRHQSENTPNPNIVILVFDTARAWNFSCYGHSRQTTPVVDNLAEEGVLFENATSVSPWTLPSHASLFTGVPPAIHRTNSLNSQLPESLVTLAELLSDLGYDTVGMSSNPWFSSQFGIIRGFDAFRHLHVPFGGDSYRQFVNILTDNRRTVLERSDSLLSKQGPITVLKNSLNAVHRQFIGLPDDGANRAIKHAKNVVERDGPYFLFINFLEPHLPYEPPDDYAMKFMPEDIPPERVGDVNQNARDYNVRNVEMSSEDFGILERLYDAEINYVDEQIGRLLEYIDAVGDRSETMVIVVGDHGENIGDHGLMSHNYSVHETLLHIPLIVRYPGVIEGGERVETRVSSLDIPATIQRLLEAESDEKFQSQQTGESLLDPTSDRTIIAEYLNPVPPISRMKARCENPDFDVSQYDLTLRAVYDDRYKLIQDSDGNQELYDVKADRNEEDDLAEQKPDVTAELGEQLENWIQKYEETGDVATVGDWDKQIEDRLRELGYL